MGKSKRELGKAGKKKKDSSLFKVAGAKVNKGKGKAKAVTTNLKRLNVKAKTESTNAAYDQIQGSLLKQVKDTPSDGKKKQPKVKRAEQQPDVDEAMDQLSNL